MKEIEKVSSAKPALTQERLKQLIRYVPDTGEFYRLTRKTGSFEIGDKAGGVPPSLGYRMISLDGVVYYGHRLAWLYMTGHWPKFQVDHRDRDPANNIWTNLREATRVQNMANRPGWSSTGHKHIATYTTRKFGLRYRWNIVFEGKAHRCGKFATIDDAIKSRDAFLAEHVGEFANTTMISRD